MEQKQETAGSKTPNSFTTDHAPSTTNPVEAPGSNPGRSIKEWSMHELSEGHTPD